MEAFIQFIIKRFRYQLIGKTDDVAMQRARINHVWRQDDRFSLWEATQLKECATLYDKILLILLGRFFISTHTVRCLLAAEGITDKPTQLRALHNAGQLFNPCIAMECDEPVDVAVSFYWKARAMAPDLVTLFEHRATAYEVWMYLVRTIPSYNRRRELNEFRIYEMVTSLSYLTEAAFNEYQFHYIGPGAVAVITELYGRLPYTQAEANSIAQQLERDLVAAGMPMPDDRHITYRVLEDCACEYRKYRRSVELGDNLPEKYRYYPGARTCTR